MVWWTVFQILFGKFAEGFLMGVILRTLVSLIFKIDMTAKGIIRTGIVVGLIYTICWVYVGYKLFG